VGRAGARASAPPAPDFDRVVITGLGTLTSAGCSTDEAWEAVASERLATSMEHGMRVGRVDLDPSPWLSPRDRRRMDRPGIFAVVASRIALEDAGLALTDENRSRVGVIFGTGIGPMESMESFCRPLFEEGPQAANPAIFPNTVYNAAGGQVAMQVGAIGPTSTVTAGHGAGASALTYAFDLTACGYADAVLALAVDTLTDPSSAATIRSALWTVGRAASRSPRQGSRSCWSACP
jgi:3-oxoacyl-[acyl-carrier-protein] synthase II